MGSISGDCPGIFSFPVGLITIIDEMKDLWSEEVGHDHLRTKSGRVAQYIALYKM